MVGKAWNVVQIWCIKKLKFEFRQRNPSFKKTSNSLGKGEAESSNLSSSTILFPELAGVWRYIICQRFKGLSPQTLGVSLTISQVCLWGEKHAKTQSARHHAARANYLTAHGISFM
jgi:hypothetical protein